MRELGGPSLSPQVACISKSLHPSRPPPPAPVYKWLKAAHPTASAPGGGEAPLGGLLGALAPLSAWMAGTPLSEVGRIVSWCARPLPPRTRTLSKQRTAPLTLAKQEHNFAKFLVGRDGRVIRRYLPAVPPEALEADVLAALAAK